MATSTFNKKIVLGPTAAKRLAKELNDPTPAIRPDKSKVIPMMDEKETREWVKKMISKSKN